MRTRNFVTAAMTCIVLVALAVHGGCGTDGGSGGDPGGGSGSGGGSATLAAAFTIFKSQLTVSVDASEVEAPDDLNSVEVRWDWTDDGAWDTAWGTVKTAEHTYADEGIYTIQLQVRDPAGRTDSAVRQFTITRVNNEPIAAFAVNVVSGMTASVDASSSADVEEPAEDLRVRWDWDGDRTWDTDWMVEKTAQYTYPASSTYTILLQVMDLNGATDEASEEVLVSPIDIRSSFFTGHEPYVVRVNFRLINKLTDQPVTPLSDPPLERRHFRIFEDREQIDISETNQLLNVETKPLHLVLILDYTGSMFDAGGIDDMVSAAKLFIDGQSENTFLSLWAFWERQGGFDEINDFVQCTSAGKALLKENLDEFTSQPRDHGATEIWTVLRNVLNEKFLPFDNGVSRAIVFLSDGHDTTSTTTVPGLINIATRQKAVAIFPVGLAFRTEQYPDDEPNLKKLAEDTSGTYFTVNQLSDLSEIFDQMAEDLQSDLVLSYVTPQSSGTHVVTVECNYLDGFASISTRVPMDDLAGDTKRGLLAVKPGPVSANQTEYIVSAIYVPRSIDTFRIRIAQASAPATLSLYDSNALLLGSEGWTISPDVEAGDPPPGDGWYTMSGPSAIEYGAFGKIAKCTVQAGARPSVTLELQPFSEQAEVYGDKTLVFGKNRSLRLEVPTFMTRISATAGSGTPADDTLPSANAAQEITVTGQGLGSGDLMILTTIDQHGTKKIGFARAGVVQTDGRSARFVLPRGVITDEVYLFDDYGSSRFLLQVVPVITSSNSSLGTFFGSGFIEGGMLAVVGGEEFLDGGLSDDDGIDVRVDNRSFVLTTSFDRSAPIYVVTDGGTSAVFAP